MYQSINLLLIHSKNLFDKEHVKLSLIRQVECVKLSLIRQVEHVKLSLIRQAEHV